MQYSSVYRRIVKSNGIGATPIRACVVCVFVWSFVVDLDVKHTMSDWASASGPGIFCKGLIQSLIQLQNVPTRRLRRRAPINIPLVVTRPLAHIQNFKPPHHTAVALCRHNDTSKRVAFTLLRWSRRSRPLNSLAQLS